MTTYVSPLADKWITKRVRVLHRGNHDHAVECRCGWVSGWHETPEGALIAHDKHYGWRHR